MVYRLRVGAGGLVLGSPGLCSSRLIRADPSSPPIMQHHQQMAANNRHGTGLRIAGFVFAMTGLVFMLSGDTAIGITAIAMGVVFIAVGGATARKAPPSADDK